MKLFNPSTTPQILTALDGHVITTREEWETIRRPEIVEMFQREVYGKVPGRPENLRFDVLEEHKDALGGKATSRVVQASFDGPLGSWSFPFYLFIPKYDQPVGALVLICIGSKEARLDMTRQHKDEHWPVEEIVDRHYAAVAFHYEDLAPDNPDCFSHSVHNCFEESRSSDSWGAIGAWAWGAMRIMDYLQTDPNINKGRIGVIGHSRGGKTALLTAMLDQRFSAVYSNSSGCVGASISRFKGGETIAQINERFPYWFTKSFMRYSSPDVELPFDQHMFLATIAPRLLYVASATNDEWADPDAELTSAKLASEAYHLYNMSGINESLYPMPDKSYGGDGIGYHRHTGPHRLTIPDWIRFMDFLDSRW